MLHLALPSSGRLMGIFGPIVPPSRAPMQAAAAPYDDKSFVANRSTEAYFFRSLRISFRTACLPAFRTTR